MKNEIKKTYQVNINPYDFDEYGLKINGYAELASMLSYEHLKSTDQGVGVLLDGKYAWAIMSMKLRIHEAIKEPKSLVGRTWYAGRKGPYYRREYELSYNNKPIIVGASYSILFDVEDRTVYRSRELPFTLLDETKITLVELDSSFRESLNYVPLMERVVLNSHIDVLGHTNHLKYVEFIYDALSEDGIEEMFSYNTMELFFQKEMLKDDVFIVNKAYSGENLVFMIYNKSRQENAFILKLSREKYD